MSAFLSHANAVAAASLLVVKGAVSNRDAMKTMQVPVPFAEITPAAGEIEIRIAFAGSTSLRVLGAIATSIRTAAQVRWELYNNGQLLFTSFQPLAVAEGPLVLAGSPLNVLAPPPTTAASLPNLLLSILPAPTTCTEVRLIVTNAGSGAVRIGGLWAAGAFEAPVSPRWTIQHEDFSLVSRVGPTPWTNRRSRVRTFAVTMQPLAENQAIGPDGLQLLLQSLGRSAPVILIPSERADRQHLSIYGLLSAPGSVSHIDAEWYRAEIDVQEMA